MALPPIISDYVVSSLLCDTQPHCLGSILNPVSFCPLNVDWETETRFLSLAVSKDSHPRRCTGAQRLPLPVLWLWGSLSSRLRFPPSWLLPKFHCDALNGLASSQDLRFPGSLLPALSGLPCQNGKPAVWAFTVHGPLLAPFEKRLLSVSNWIISLVMVLFPLCWCFCECCWVLFLMSVYYFVIVRPPEQLSKWLFLLGKKNWIPSMCLWWFPEQVKTSIRWWSFLIEKETATTEALTNVPWQCHLNKLWSCPLPTEQNECSRGTLSECCTSHNWFTLVLPHLTVQTRRMMNHSAGSAVQWSQLCLWQSKPARGHCPHS